MDVSDLERASVEFEVHNVNIDGHDDSAGHDEQEEPCQADGRAAVETSKNAIEMEKCISSQNTLHHYSCSFMERSVEDQDVKEIMFTKKNIYWNLLGCFLAV